MLFSQGGFSDGCSMDALQLFVYGTLKPGEANYDLYCGDRVLSAQKVYTWGELYHLSLGYPGLTVGDRKVYGILLRFRDDSVLEQIDRLEGYDPSRPPEENEYQRCRLPLFDLSDRFYTEAWGYRMATSKVHQYRGVLILSGWWTPR
jgi:gamma-glutamylcyclotransferase (GGCT)/AIG2-like uncharacterized protein YtfP